MRTSAAFLLLIIWVVALFAVPSPLPVTGWSPLSEPVLRVVAGANDSALQCPAEEYEPNDSFAAAYPISAGPQYTAYICPSGDQDWFKFSVQVGQDITVDLTGLYGDLPADYDLDLYDPGGVMVAQSHGGFTYPEHIEGYTAQQTGEYRVQVSGYGGAYSGVNPYRVRVTLGAVPTATRTSTPIPTASATATLAPTHTRTATPAATASATATVAPTRTHTPTPVPSCPADAYEENGSFDAAAPIEAGVSYSAYICPGGDEDYFKFWLSSGQGFTVLLSNLPASYDLEVYDPNRAKRISSYGTTPAPREVTFTVDRTGYWYARVMGSDAGQWSVNPYSLRVTLSGLPTTTATRTPTLLPTPTWTPTRTATPAASHTAPFTPTRTATPISCPTGYEPDDTFEDATTITFDEALQSFICPSGDVDTFRFFLDLGQEVSVHLYNMSHNADLEVYDPSKTLTGQSNNQGTTPEELVVIAEVEGWFYARVFGTEDNWVNAYTLLVAPSAPLTPTPTQLPTQTPLYPGCPNDVHEPNDECGADKPSWNVTTYSTQSYICAATDVDYWRIPSVAISETIDIALNPGSKDYRLSLYDPQCRLVKSSLDAYKGTVRMRHTASVAGMWYVKVESALGFSTTEPYTIMGRVDACVRDRLEDNDDVRLRTPLDRPLTARVEGGLSICPTDEQDWFGVRLEPGDNLIASLTHDSSIGPLKMCLYDVVATDILQCTDPFLGLNRIDHVSSVYGTHYLVVDGAAPGVMNHDYSISVQVRGPTPTPTPTLTPTPTPAPPLNLSVQELEVTQAIQDLQNSIPLVKGKLTRARVYVGAPAGVTRLSGLEVWLYGYANNPYGSALPGSPLKIGPGTYTLAGGTVAQKRLSLASSFNFEIPATWQTYGSIALRAVVNPNRTFSETNFGDNELIDSVFWKTCSTVNLKLVSVTSDGITVSLSSDLVTAGLSWMKDVYPIHQLNVSTLASGAISATRDYAAPGVGGSCSAQWSALVADMADIYDNWTNRPANAFVYGFLSPNVPHCRAGRCNLGCGRVNGHAAAGILAADAGETLAHEVGHNLGRLHAPCSVPDPDPNWPKDTNPNGSIGEVGVRWSTSTVFGPGTPDFMSYCSPPWVSTVTYRALQNKLCTASASSAEGAGSASPHLVASGWVSGGKLELRPLWVLDQPAGDYNYPGEGPYSLELQDALGAVLFVRRFDPAAENQGPGHTSDHFHEIVPYAPQTQRVVFRQGDVILGTVQVSPHAPQVTVLSPNGGEVWGAAGAYTIAWQATDADGDPLVAHVLYSFDGGASWEPLAVNLNGNQYTVQGDRLPGSDQVLVKVRVSDGVNTTDDESDAPFRVSRKAPSAFLLQPRDGTTVQPGTPVVFSGLATDPEDGPLPAESLAWSSDLDGVLGSGADVAVDTLSRGMHRITLSATDSDGNVATDTIRLVVGSQIYLPIVRKK